MIRHSGSQRVHQGSRAGGEGRESRPKDILENLLGVPGAPEGRARPLPAPSDPRGLALWRGHARPGPRWTHPGAASAGRGRALPELGRRGPRRRRNRNSPRDCRPLGVASRGSARAPRRGESACQPMASWAPTRDRRHSPRPGCGPERAGALLAPVHTRPRRCLNSPVSKGPPYFSTVAEPRTLPGVETPPLSEHPSIPVRSTQRPHPFTCRRPC